MNRQILYLTNAALGMTLLMSSVAFATPQSAPAAMPTATQPSTTSAPQAEAKPSAQLSVEQRRKLRDIKKQAHEQAASIRHDAKLSEAQKKEKLAQLRASTREQCKSVLTAEQQKNLTERHHGWRRASMRHEGMEGRMNLTAEQKDKLAALRASTRQQRESTLNNQSLTAEQKLTELAKIRASAHQQMESILTPEQMLQMEQMRMHKGRHCPMK